MGYIGSKYSERASMAKEEGKLVLSEIRKTDLEDEGINIPLGLAKFILERTQTEWHHTGTYYNETRFYSIEQLKTDLEEMTSEELETYKSNYANMKEDEKKERAEKKAAEEGEKATYIKLNYYTWEGTRNHPKKVLHTRYAIKYKNWAYMVIYGKKNLDGKNILDYEEYSKKPEELTWRDVNYIITNNLKGNKQSLNTWGMKKALER